MIDLDRMRDLYIAGNKALGGLTDKEKDLLIGFCALAGQDILKNAQANHMTTQVTIINAYQFGIGMGLSLKIENGEMKER